MSEFAAYLERHEQAQKFRREWEVEKKLQEFACLHKVFVAEQTPRGLVVYTGVGNITIHLQPTTVATHKYILTVVSDRDLLTVQNYAILIDRDYAKDEFVERFANELQHAVQTHLNCGLFAAGKTALVCQVRPMQISIRGMDLERKIISKAIRSKRQSIDLNNYAAYTVSLSVVAPQSMVDVCGPICAYYIDGHDVDRVSFASNKSRRVNRDSSDYMTAMHLKRIAPKRMPLTFEQIHQNQIYFADSFRRAYKRVREEIRRTGEPTPQVPEEKLFTAPQTASVTKEIIAELISKEIGDSWINQALGDVPKHE